MDRPVALEFFKRIVSGVAFKTAIAPTVSLESRIELFSYTALFAYGAKAVRRFDFGRVMVIRASRILQTIMATNIIASAALSTKMLSIFPWYTVTLLALGLDDMMRQAVVYQQFLAMTHKNLMAATPMSSIIALIAAITRDYSQRLRWVQSVELLAAGNIPPYYDAYRCQILASDILLQEDGMFPWDALYDADASLAASTKTNGSNSETNGEPKTSSSAPSDTVGPHTPGATNGTSTPEPPTYSVSLPLAPLSALPGGTPKPPSSPSVGPRSTPSPMPPMSEEELAYRENLLIHIDAALLKLPGYPTYVFRDFDMIQRCVEAAFAASKAVTLAVLGRLSEAEPLAAAAMATIQLGDVSTFATVAVIAMVSAMQVIVAAKRTDLVIKGFAMLNACVPEFPRTVRVIYKIAHRLKLMGVSISDLIAQSGYEEAKLFSNLNFHSQSVLTPILARVPSAMLPTGAITSPLLPPTYVGRVSGTPTTPNSLASSLGGIEGARASAFTVISNPAPTGSFSAPIFPIAMRPHIPGRNPYYPNFRGNVGTPSPKPSSSPQPPQHGLPFSTVRSPMPASLVAASPMGGLDILGNLAASSPHANGNPQQTSLAQQQQASLAQQQRLGMGSNFSVRAPPSGSPQRVAHNIPGVATLVGGQLRSMPVSSPWDFMGNPLRPSYTSWGANYAAGAPNSPSWPLTAAMPTYGLEQLSEDQNFLGSWTTAPAPLNEPAHPLSLLGAQTHASKDESR